jgi:hypothetical protein
VVEGPSQGVEPNAFTLTVTDSGGRNFVIGGPAPPPICEEERISVDPEGVGMNPGAYTVTEDPLVNLPNPDRVEVDPSSDCEQDPSNPLRATGEIQEGESQECIFINIYEDDT